jgi:hypothetical protein
MARIAPTGRRDAGRSGDRAAPEVIELMLDRVSSACDSALKALGSRGFPDTAAALRVAVAEASAEYPPDEIRAMVEAELRAQALDTPLAHG